MTLNDLTAPPDGGPAFPGPDGAAQIVTAGHGLSYAIPTMHPGMSRRDWFAGQAIAGFLASKAGLAMSPDMPGIIKMIAQAAYQMADAMIAASQEGSRG